MRRWFATRLRYLGDRIDTLRMVLVWLVESGRPVRRVRLFPSLV